jgi:hypothetical protein
VRGATRAIAAALLGALFAGFAGPARATDLVTLEGPERVDGLRVGDANGDGIDDVLAMEGRTLWFWPGVKGSLPLAAPGAKVPLPEDVTAVALAGAAAPGGAGVLVLGDEGLRRVAIAAGRMSAVEAGAGLPHWRDSRKAAFVDFVMDDGTVLLPIAQGIRILRPSADGPVVQDVEVEPSVALEPAGAFLEDTWRVVRGTRYPVFGSPPEGAGEGAAGTLWLLAGRQLVALAGEERTTWDLARLPPGGVRRLIDLDANGVPDLYQTEGTNRSGVYRFYRLPPLRTGEDGIQATPLDLSVPTTRIRLEGSQVEPRHVDLDGDGRLDFVVTVIPIDARNTARALQGQVTATTMAFLNQGGTGGFYPASPDASVASDVGVAIRFTQAGTIDVRRSFTILPDADVDGDGRKDLVIRTGTDELTVRRGSRSGVWEAEGKSVAVPDIGESPNVEGYTGDLDGDGGDEILLLYRAPPGGRDRLRVIKP